ncbi:phosphoglycerate kinase [Chloroflexota bacterium]
MAKKTIRDVEVDGKRVLVRVDFNVPQDIETGAITDDSRIKAALPTIKYLIDHNAKVILCSHLGRPDGKVVESFRMAPVAQALSKCVGRQVLTVADCIGTEVENVVNNLDNGQILLLENLRFHKEEEENSPDFSRSLANLADIYVDDAFGTAHRSHASTVGVAGYLPAVSGLLMEKELGTLGRLLDNPEHPFAAILGGAKVSDKIALVENILTKVDTLLIGGGMAATFLKMKWYEVGRSPVEEEKLDILNQLDKMIQRNHVNLLLPVDAVVTDNIDKQASAEIVPISNVQPPKFIVDIGPQTIELFSNELRKCRTIFWNGPMGVYEIPQFSRGTKSMVQMLSQLDATTVIGGGSTAEIVNAMNLTDKMTHVSTGGGASLKFLEGKTLPGVAVLQDKDG